MFFSCAPDCNHLAMQAGFIRRPTMDNTFLPLIFRMRHISRWSLMFNTEKEDLMQHTAECAFLTHFLATIGNRFFGKQYDVNRLAVCALFHDASEVLTGDLPTPIKYHNDLIRDAYKEVEDIACTKLLATLPDEVPGVGSITGLLAQLRRVEPAEAGLVPQNSLLREFI